MTSWSTLVAATTSTTRTAAATTTRGAAWRQWLWLLPQPIARVFKRLLLRLMALWLNSPLRQLRITNRAAAPRLEDEPNSTAQHVPFADDSDSTAAHTRSDRIAVNDNRNMATSASPGLVNTGNTCFVNAILQCLAALPAFETSVTRALESLQRIEQDCERSGDDAAYAHAQQPNQKQQNQRMRAATALLLVLRSLAPPADPLTDTNDSDDSDDSDESDDSGYSTPDEVASAHQSMRGKRRRRRAVISDRSRRVAPPLLRAASPVAATVDRATLNEQVRAFLDALRPCTSLLAKPHAAQEQQDAEEFLSFLLELLHELLHTARATAALDATERAYFDEGEAFYARALAQCHPLEPQTYTDVVAGLGDLRWQRFLKQNDSVVTDLFVGQIVRGSQCCSCASLTCLHQELRVLPLSVDARAQAQTLAHCLAAHRNAERLDAANRVFCDRHCRMNTSRVTQVLVQRAPRLLVVQLQRFQQTANSFALEKICTPVQFPIGSSSGDLLDLTANMFVRSDAARVQYTLVGVCAHVGATLDAGHYVAYVRRASHWLRVDDDVVTQLDATRVRDETLASAYLLFYARVVTR